MDFASLKDQVANISLYDIKAGVRKVQNAVMNYTEMEAKVREATNNEPWGASSTLMQEIANGTYSYQLLNEIMPMIYKRFTEKAAEEWRQIYKGLQLLEFLIKNGSERVIDDARSHLSLLKMLKQFQFLDQNGKDQGINVRNRAKELADLLSDVEKIRAERKKARANRNKFGGVEGGRGIGMGGGGPSKYGGFGSEDAGYGGYSGGVYGDGGGFGGAENSSNFHDNSTRRDKFEEYDEGDDAEAAPRRGHKKTPSVSRAKVETPKKKEPEVDLFDFGDNDVSPAPPPKATSSSNGKQPANNGSAAPADDDDFDDFISATPEPSVSGLPKPAAPLSGFAAIPPPTSSVSSSTQFAAPKPVSAAQGNTMSGMVGLNSISPAPSASTLPFSTPSSTFSSPPPGAFQSQQPPMAAQPPRPTGYQAPQPNYFTSISVASAASSAPAGARPGMAQSTGSFGSGSSAAKPAAAKSSGDAFGSLWSTASASAGIKTAGGAGAGGPKLGDLAKQKATAGIWGAAAGAKPATPQQQQQQQQQAKPTGGSAFDDLLG